jgi:type IX secretion system PorP/SprF family membrane protein
MKKIFLLSVPLLISFLVSGQDIHFSQYLQAPLLVNPGSTGLIEGNHRLISNYKSQWKAMGTTFKTMSFSYDGHLLKSKNPKGAYLGLGLYFFQDQSGDGKLTQNQVNISLSGILPVDENNKISLGLQGGFANKSIQPESLRWGNQYNGVNYESSLPSNEHFVQTSYSFFDISTGVVWQYRQNTRTFHNGNELSKIDLGISVNHLNTPTQYFLQQEDRLKTKLVCFGSMDMEINDSRFALITNAYFIKQGTQKELVLGGLMKYYISKRKSRYTGFGNQSALFFGTQYRFKDAIIPTVMLEKEGFTLGLSYDVSVSQLKQVSPKGGFEVVLKYIVNNKNQHFTF